jgi:hypothetical protein
MGQTIVAVLGAALAAFGIWLIVRIINRRERWAIWTAAGLAILMVVHILRDHLPATIAIACVVETILAAWQTVSMGVRRKMRDACKWGALLTLMLALPLSVGPACWLSSRFDCGADAVSGMYQFVIWARNHSPHSIRDRVSGTLDWYSELAASDDWHWITHVELGTGYVESRWTSLDREAARHRAARRQGR